MILNISPLLDIFKFLGNSNQLSLLDLTRKELHFLQYSAFPLLSGSCIFIIQILAYLRTKSNHFFICYPPFYLNIYSLS
nr:MAG TPA: hypothetical protein [Caudoviricetes sp.]